MGENSKVHVSASEASQAADAMVTAAVTFTGRDSLADGASRNTGRTSLDVVPPAANASEISPLVPACLDDSSPSSPLGEVQSTIVRRSLPQSPCTDTRAAHRRYSKG